MCGLIIIYLANYGVIIDHNLLIGPLLTIFFKSAIIACIFACFDPDKYYKVKTTVLKHTKELGIDFKLS